VNVLIEVRYEKGQSHNSTKHRDFHIAEQQLARLEAIDAAKGFRKLEVNNPDIKMKTKKHQ